MGTFEAHQFSGRKTPLEWARWLFQAVFYWKIEAYTLDVVRNCGHISTLTSHHNSLQAIDCVADHPILGRKRQKHQQILRGVNGDRSGRGNFVQVKLQLNAQPKAQRYEHGEGGHPARDEYGVADVGEHGGRVLAAEIVKLVGGQNLQVGLELFHHFDALGDGVHGGRADCGFHCVTDESTECTLFTNGTEPAAGPGAGIYSTAFGLWAFFRVEWSRNLKIEESRKSSPNHKS